MTLETIELDEEPIVLFTDVLCNIAKSCMPRTTAKQKKRCKPWFNTKCKYAMKARKYGSQLWNFDSKMVEPYYVSWRKMVRLLWNLPRTTHCDFLSTINSSLPMDIALEKRCSKFLWASLNSKNKVV